MSTTVADAKLRIASALQIDHSWGLVSCRYCDQLTGQPCSVRLSEQASFNANHVLTRLAVESPVVMRPRGTILHDPLFIPRLQYLAQNLFCPTHAGTTTILATWLSWLYSTMRNPSLFTMDTSLRSALSELGSVLNLFSRNEESEPLIHMLTYAGFSIILSLCPLRDLTDTSSIIFDSSFGNFIRPAVRQFAVAVMQRCIQTTSSPIHDENNRRAQLPSRTLAPPIPVRSHLRGLNASRFANQNNNNESSSQTSTSASETEESCCICQEPFSGPLLVSCLFCENRFHIPCISTWASDTSNEGIFHCPLCRGNWVTDQLVNDISIATNAAECATAERLTH